MKAILDVKLFSTLALILALAIAPVFSNAFAQSDNVEESENMDELEEVQDELQDNEVDEIEEDVEDEQQTDESERIRELREKYRDQLKEEREAIRDQMKEERDAYRDQIKTHIDQLKEKRKALHDEFRPFISDISPRDYAGPVDPDREPDLIFKGEVAGWAILGGKAYPAEMHLSGEAFHAGHGMWQLTATGEITVEGHTAILDLKGHARENYVMLHGSGMLSTNDEPTIRVQLRGHYAPTANGDEFAIAFTNAVVHNTNNGHRIPLALVGSVVTESVSDTGIIPVVPEVDTAPTIDEILS